MHSGTTSTVLLCDETQQAGWRATRTHFQVEEDKKLRRAAIADNHCPKKVAKARLRIFQDFESMVYNNDMLYCREQ